MTDVELMVRSSIQVFIQKLTNQDLKDLVQLVLSII